MEQAKVTLLLPVYNEAETIEAVISQFYEEIATKIPLEIVVAEDGSIDGTKDILRRLSEKIPMKLIFGEERKGYSNGLIDGLNNVDTEFVVFVDSDGQHLAKDFWRLYELRERCDVVSGWRVKRADGFYRKLMSSVFQRLARFLFGLPKFHDITGPYKFMRTHVAKEIAKEFKYMRESFWTEFTIRACKNGFSIVEVPVTHRPRMHGSTNVYKPKEILRIVFSQLKGLLKLWEDLKNGKVNKLTFTIDRSIGLSRQPLVSIIIPSKRETPFLRRCLLSLEEQDYPTSLLEVIVASVEPHNLEAKRISMRNICCGQANQAEARNIAETSSKGEVLAFCDDDCVLPPTWIKNAVKHFKDKSVATVGGPSTPPLRGVSFDEIISGLVMMSFLGAGSHRKAYTSDAETKPHLCGTVDIICANMFVDRAKFREVGGFDGIVPQEEDRLNTKFLRGGYKLIYDPECYNAHYQRPWGLRAIKNIFWLMTGQGSLTIDRHASSSKWYLVPPLFAIGLTVGPFLFSFAPLKHLYITFVFIYMISVIAETLRLLSKNKDELNNLQRFTILITLPFVFLIHHLTSGFGFLYGFFRQLLSKNK